MRFWNTPLEKRIVTFGLPSFPSRAARNLASVDQHSREFILRRRFMTAAGWAFMLISIGAVLSLVSFCYYKLLTGKESSNDGDKN